LNKNFNDAFFKIYTKHCSLGTFLLVQQGGNE